MTTQQCNVHCSMQNPSKLATWIAFMASGTGTPNISCILMSIWPRKVRLQGKAQPHRRPSRFFPHAWISQSIGSFLISTGPKGQKEQPKETARLFIFKIPDSIHQGRSAAPPLFPPAMSHSPVSDTPPRSSRPVWTSFIFPNPCQSEILCHTMIMIFEGK